MKICSGGHSAGLTGEIRKPGAHIGAPGTMQFTTRTYAAASILERGDSVLWDRQEGRRSHELIEWFSMQCAAACPIRASPSSYKTAIC